MEKVFKRAIDQSEDSEPAEVEGFLVYKCDDHEETDLGQFANFNSVLEDYDEDDDNFASKMTRLYGYIDFDETDLFDPEVGLERYSTAIADLNEMDVGEEAREGQIIFKPHFCIGPFHWAVGLHKDANLPQVLGGELLESLFLLNDVLADHSPIIGFNSLLAGALENKLHVECLLGTAHPDHRPGKLAELQMVELLSSSLIRKEMDAEPTVIQADSRVT